MPPAARATMPSRAVSAPEKAPLRCPNRVSENRVSSRPATLTGTNSPLRPLKPVHRLRQQLLAGTGLTGDQHRLAGAGDGLQVLKQRAHLAAYGDDAGKRLTVLQPVRHQAALEGAHLAAQGAQLQRALDAGDEAALLHRLDQIVEGPLLHAGHRGLDLLARGHDDHRQLRMVPDDLRQQLGTRDVGHEQVQHHHRHLLLRQQRHQLPAVLHGLHVLDAGTAENHPGAEQHRGLVVDQYHRERSARLLCHTRPPHTWWIAGIRMVTVVPLPSTDSKPMLPPCLSMMEREIDSPRPVPPASVRVVKKGSVSRPEVAFRNAAALIPDGDRQHAVVRIEAGADVHSLGPIRQGLQGVQQER